jgi:UPF0716 protein FxsA
VLLKLILLLSVVPFTELYLLVKLTEWWDSFWYTVLLIVATGVLGGWLARREGLRALRRIQNQLGEGQLPGAAMLDGLLILIAGALLLTPGIITDAVGLLLLAPPGRRAARRLLTRWIKRRMAAGDVVFHSSMGFRPIHREPPPGSPPLEEDYEDH